MDITSNQRERIKLFLTDNIKYNVSPEADGFCGLHCLEMAMNKIIKKSLFNLYGEKEKDNYTTIQMNNVCRYYNHGFAFTQNPPETRFVFDQLYIMSYNEDFNKFVVVNLYSNHYTLFCTEGNFSNRIVNHRSNVSLMVNSGTICRKLLKTPVLQDVDESVEEDDSVIVKDVIENKDGVNGNEEDVSYTKYKPNKKIWKPLDLFVDEYTDYSSESDIVESFKEYQNFYKDSVRCGINMPVYKNLMSYENLFKRLSKYTREHAGEAGLISYYLKMRSNIFQVIFLHCMYKELITKTDYEFPTLYGNKISDKTPDFIGTWGGCGIILEFTISNKSLTAITNKKSNGIIKYEHEASLLGYDLHHIQLILEQPFDEFVTNSLRMLKIQDNTFYKMRRFYDMCKSDKTFIVDNYDDVAPVKIPDHAQKADYIFKGDLKHYPTFQYKIIGGKYYNFVMDNLKTIKDKLTRANDRYKKINKSRKGTRFIILARENTNTINVIENNKGYYASHILSQIDYNEEFVFQFVRKNIKNPLNFEDGIPVRYNLIRNDSLKLCSDSYYEDQIDNNNLNENILSNYKDKNLINESKIKNIESSMIETFEKKQSDMQFKLKSSFKQLMLDMDNLYSGDIKDTRQTCDLFKDTVSDNLISAVLNKFNAGTLLTHLELKEENKEKFEELNQKLKDKTLLYNLCVKSISMNNGVSFKSVIKNSDKFQKEDYYYKMIVNEGLKEKVVVIDQDEFDTLKTAKLERDKQSDKLKRFKVKYSEIIKDQAVRIKNNKKDPNSIVNRSFDTWKTKKVGKVLQGWGNEHIDIEDYRFALKSYYANLLQLNENEGLESLMIDTNQYTDLVGINKVKKQMLENNTVLSKFTDYTKLSCLLQFNQSLFKILYHHSMKTDHSDGYYIDNLGYKNALIIIRGGSSALKTNNTKAYRVIFPVNDLTFKVMFNRIDIQGSDYETFTKFGIRYLVTPWLTQNINLCKTFMTSGFQYALSMSIIVQRMINDNQNTPETDTLLVENYLPFYLIYHNYRQTEGYLHNMRYILFNNLSIYSDYESLLPGLMYYNQNAFQCMIQKCVIYQLQAIYKQLSRVNKANYRLNDIFQAIVVNNVFTGHRITSVTAFCEMFYTSFAMRKGYYTKKLEQRGNLLSVLESVISTDDRYDKMPYDISDKEKINYYFKMSKFDNVNERFRNITVDNVGKEPLHYSSNVICNSAQILQGVLLNKNNKDFYYKMFNKVILNQVDYMANSNGLRGDGEHKDFFGAKGYDVIYTRLLEILKRKLGTDSIDTKHILEDYKENPDKFFYSFLDAIEDNELEEAVLHQVDKEQRNLGREIYVLDYKTKIYQQIIEKFLSKICKNVDNEVISISSSDRQSYIHRKFIMSEAEYKDYETFTNCSLDCRKWAPMSNNYKYIDFINNMSEVLPKPFIQLFNYFFKIYTTKKKVYTRNYVVEDLIKDKNMRDLSKLLIKDDSKSDDAYYFCMPHSFMMGIFNYLSSLCHSANQMLAARTIIKYNRKMKIPSHVIAIAHSDDSMMRIFSKTESSTLINNNLKIYEHCLKCCNHLLSPKKCNTNIYRVRTQQGSNYLEFLSILYIKGELIPMIPKFSSNIEYNATDAGFSSDMSSAVSKTVELLSNGATFQEAYIAMKVISSSIMYFYGLINSQKLADDNFKRMRDMPYYFMGAMDCHPIFYIMMGSDAELIRYMICDPAKIDKIVNVMSKLNIELDVNESGLGLNWNFKHNSTLKIRNKIESMPKIEDEGVSWILNNIKNNNKSLFNVLWYSNMLNNRNFANSITQENELIKMNRVFTSINQKCIATMSGNYTPNEFMYLMDNHINSDDSLLSKMDLEIDNETVNFYDTLTKIMNLIYKKEKSFYISWNDRLKGNEFLGYHVVTLKPSVIHIRSKNLAVPDWFKAIDFVILDRLKELDYFVDNSEQKKNVCQTIKNFFALSNFDERDLNLNQLKYTIQKVLTKNNKSYKIYTTRDSGNKYINSSLGLIEWLQVNTFYHNRIDYKPFNDQVFNYTTEDWNLRQNTYELCLTYNYAKELAIEQGFNISEQSDIYKENALKVSNYSQLGESIIKFGLNSRGGMVYDPNCYIVWLNEQKRLGQNWVGNGEVYLRDDEIDMVIRFSNTGIFSASCRHLDTHVFSNKMKDLLTASILYNNENTNPTNLEYVAHETLFLGIDYNNILCIDYRGELKSVFTRVYEQEFNDWDLDTLYIDDRFKYKIKNGKDTYKVNFPYESSIERKYILSKYLKLIDEFKGNEFLKKILDDNYQLNVKAIDPFQFYTTVQNTVLYGATIKTNKEDGSSFYLNFLEISKERGRNDLKVDDLSNNIAQVGGLKYMMPDELYKDMLKSDKSEMSSNPTILADYISKRDFRIQNKNSVRDLLKINAFKMFFPKQCWLDIGMCTENDNYRQDFTKLMMRAFNELNAEYMFIESNRMFVYNYIIYNLQFIRTTQLTNIMKMLQDDMNRLFNLVGEDKVEEFLAVNNFSTPYINTFNINGVMRTATLVDYFINSIQLSFSASYSLDKVKQMILQGQGIKGTVTRLQKIDINTKFEMPLNELCERMFGRGRCKFDKPVYNYVQIDSHELPWMTVKYKDRIIPDINNLVFEDGGFLDLDEDDIIDTAEDEDIIFGDNGDDKIYTFIQLGQQMENQLTYMLLRYNNFLVLSDHLINLETSRCGVKVRYIFNSGPLRGFYVYYRVKHDNMLEDYLQQNGFIRVYKKQEDIMIPELKGNYPMEGDPCNQQKIMFVYNNMAMRKDQYRSFLRNQDENLRVLETVLTDSRANVKELIDALRGIDKEKLSDYELEFKRVQESLMARQELYGENEKASLTLEDCMSLLISMSEENMLALMEGMLDNVPETHEAIKQSTHLHLYSENNNIILDDKSIVELEGFCNGLKDMLFKDGFYITIADKKNIEKKLSKMKNMIKYLYTHDMNINNMKYSSRIKGLIASIQVIEKILGLSSDKKHVGNYAFDKIDRAVSNLNHCLTTMSNLVLGLDDEDEYKIEVDNLFSMSHYELVYKD